MSRLIRVMQGAGRCLAPFLLLIALVCVPAAAQDDPLAALSLEQQVAQMFFVHLYGDTLTIPDQDFLTRYQPGGVVLMDTNTGSPADVTRLVNRYQQAITAAGGLPLLVAADQEMGPIRALEDGFTAFPTPTLLTATANPALAAAVGAALAAELRALGVNMDFAPVADLETNRANTVINRRSAGSFPEQVAPMIAAFVQGMQSGGVLATVKHFPGHGDSSADSHTSLPVIALDRERLETTELVPFRAALESGVEAVMVAHIWYPALEPQENRPASLSHAVITDVLRGELGFDGLILTDALDMDAIDTQYGYSEAVVQAIEAGVDMLLSAHVGPQAHAEAIAAVVAAVESGRLTEARIEDSVRRILAVKARYGVLAWQTLDPQTADARVDQAAHQALSDSLFAQGVTLVANAGLVPLSADGRYALIYPGTRNLIGQACGGANALPLAVSESPTPDEIAAAQNTAARAEVAVVFTQNVDETPAQAALVNALPLEKTIVIALQSPYDVLAFPQVGAYLVTYSPQVAAIPAACDILLGRQPARGRLSVAIPGLSS